MMYGRPIGPPKVGGEEVIPYRKRRSTYDKILEPVFLVTPEVSIL